MDKEGERYAVRAREREREMGQGKGRKMEGGGEKAFFPVINYIANFFQATKAARLKEEFSWKVLHKYMYNPLLYTHNNIV